MAVPISTYIGRFVGSTTLPLFIGFLICSGLSLIILAYLQLAAKKELAALKE
jgi:DHA1 family bicyclomycin/chloramphenicol resistance-like MFS transporter